ncbi:immunoglobulin superfamily member 3 precursor, partial [Triplophysa rosa]
CSCLAQRQVTVQPGPLIRMEGSHITIWCNVTGYKEGVEQDFEWSMYLYNAPDREIRIVSTSQQNYAYALYSQRVNNKEIYVERLSGDSGLLHITKLRVTDQGMFECYTPNTDSSYLGSYSARTNLTDSSSIDSEEWEKISSFSSYAPALTESQQKKATAWTLHNVAMCANASQRLQAGVWLTTSLKCEERHDLARLSKNSGQEPKTSSDAITSSAGKFLSLMKLKYLLWFNLGQELIQKRGGDIWRLNETFSTTEENSGKKNAEREIYKKGMRETSWVYKMKGDSGEVLEMCPQSIIRSIYTYLLQIFSLSHFLKMANVSDGFCNIQATAFEVDGEVSLDPTQDELHNLLSLKSSSLRVIMEVLDVISSSLCQPYSIDQERAHMLPPVPAPNRLPPSVLFCMENSFIAPLHPAFFLLNWNGCICRPPVRTTSTPPASWPILWASSHVQALPLGSDAAALSATCDPFVASYDISLALHAADISPVVAQSSTAVVKSTIVESKTSPRPGLVETESKEVRVQVKSKSREVRVQVKTEAN